jgi:hypothetical protein
MLGLTEAEGETLGLIDGDSEALIEADGLTDAS